MEINAQDIIARSIATPNHYMFGEVGIIVSTLSGSYQFAVSAVRVRRNQPIMEEDVIGYTRWERDEDSARRTANALWKAYRMSPEDRDGEPVDSPNDNDLAFMASPPSVTTVSDSNSGGCENGKCSWSDKCRKHRAQDYAHSGNVRDLHRAYND